MTVDEQGPDEIVLLDDGKARTTTIVWNEGTKGTRERVLESTDGWEIELTMLGLIARRQDVFAPASDPSIEVLAVAPQALVFVHTVLSDDH